MAIRLGTWFWVDEPLWVQVRVAAERAAQEGEIELVAFDSPLTQEGSEIGAAFLEDLRALDLDCVLCGFLPRGLLLSVLESGLPVIHLGEADLDHPRLWSLGGLYEAAFAAGLYLSGQLPSGARVMAVGGGTPHPGSGQNRLSGFRDGLRRVAGVQFTHLPTEWAPAAARHKVESTFRALTTSVDALFGLSDPLALLARDVGLATGIITAKTPVAGINGDPLALASILRGELSATVDLNPEDLGERVIELARAVAVGKAQSTLRPHTLLINAANVGEATARKLIALAELPSRLVGVNRDLEDQRAAHMEASFDVARRMMRCRDAGQLVHEMPEAIRFIYAYDSVQFYHHHNGRLTPHASGTQSFVPLPDEPLGVAACGQAVFIADACRSNAYVPDARCPEVRSRALVPVQRGDEVQGVLDFHALFPARHRRQDLPGLQWLAEQLALALDHAAPRASPGQVETRPAPLRKTKRPPSPPVVRPAPLRGHPNVLVVDGDPRARLLYRDLLEQAVPARTLHTVTDGKQALQTLEHEVPALLILDLDLPKVAGTEVLSALRSQPAGHDVPVLVLSRRFLNPEDLPFLTGPRLIYQHKATLGAAEFCARIAFLEMGPVLAASASMTVKRAVTYIQKSHALDFTREALAAEMGMSANHMSHIFLKEMGLSPWTYLHRVRVDRAKLLLRGPQSVQAVANAAGFEDASYFARVFRRLVGVTPHEFRTLPPVSEVLCEWRRESSAPGANATVNLARQF